MQKKNNAEMREALRIYLLGAWVDPIAMDEAVKQIIAWCPEKAGKYVATPNLDCCRLLMETPGLAQAYAEAGLVLADGWPLIAASRLTRFPLQRRVTGADIIAPLCAASAAGGYSIFLLGTTKEVLSLSAERLRRTYPGLVIAGTYSPPLGFENDPLELAHIDEIIRSAAPSIIFTAFGTPKQELWMQQHVGSLSVGAAIGIGAGLDFIAGKKRRAPTILQWLALEWLWRLATEPRRLGRRYAACLVALPGLFIAHLRQHLILKAGIQRKANMHPLPQG